MPSNAVPGFLPSRYGFRFANSWPVGPARTWALGLIHIGIGDVNRGLCGGMALAALDRFESGETAGGETVPPAPGTPLFTELVDRQFASFGRLYSVPLRFWAAAVASDRRRLRATVRQAWPAIRAEIDAGRPAMVGLVRQAGWNPMSVGMGHQVLAYRYEVSRGQAAIGVYDPNHPGDDTVELRLDQSGDGEIRCSQTTREPLLGLLYLPCKPAGQPPESR